jgi:two-component system, chemotaxis family, protein-glutamate methylesterase/glutaminase
MRKIRTLIVDDAVVVRQLVSRALGEDPQVEVVGTAPNGRIALSKVEQLSPDVVTLDLDMPDMDGLETLAALKKSHPDVEVIIFSALTERGAAAALEALARGAADVVTKPANMGKPSEAVFRVREELLPRVRALGAHRVHPPTLSLPPPLAPRPAALPAQIDVVAIGCSTGGPNALAELLAALPATFPVPIAIVQHMPPIFTRLLAERLTKGSALKVREAAEGDVLRPGEALLAPGNFHLALFRDGPVVRAQLHQGPLENSCRPSVDVLFRAVASVYGARALGVVLTGMGQDGLRGAEDIRAVGGRLLVQDEETSVVWGMPGVVANAGLADRVLPIGQLAQEICRRVAEGRPQRSTGAPPAVPTGPVS